MTEGQLPSSSAGTREGPKQWTVGIGLRWGAVAISSIVSLVAIFHGPTIAATHQRQAEHEKHVRDRRADAYIAQLVSCLRQVAYMRSVYPLGRPTTDEPSPPSDEERWLTTACVLAYGSERMKGLVNEWERLVWRFKWEAWLLDPMFGDEESDDSRKERHRKMGQITADADKLFKDIENTVADELQMSLPVVPQDPSDSSTLG
jgi:hypothetical protein